MAHRCAHSESAQPSQGRNHCHMHFFSHKMTEMRKTLEFALALAVIAGLGRCASPPAPVELTREEITRRESVLSRQLMEEIASKFRPINDIELSVFLRKVGERIAKASPTTQNVPLGVFLLPDEGDRWTTFGVPGNRIYVSSHLVRALDHENTLAAVFALELAHLGNRHLAKRPHLTTDMTLTLEELKTSTRDATTVLYEAGYDPRGLDQLFAILGEHPQSGFSAMTLRALRAETRMTLVSLPPLRNPTIRTADFLRFKKRLEGRS